MPEIIVILTGLALLLLDAFLPRLPKGALAGIGIAGLSLSLAFNRPVAVDPELARHALTQADSLGCFFKTLIATATAGVILLGVSYRPVLARSLSGEKTQLGIGEYLILPLFAAAGMMWMASAADLVLLFVALELSTITFYILVSAQRRQRGSVEAGVKYLVLGALTTGVLVYGIAWLYGASGTTSLVALADFARTPAAAQSPALFGLALLLLALGFKVGAAPAQVWIPDVYQGAPTPTTALLSIASKSAGVIALLRIFLPFLDPASPARPALLIALGALAVATLLIGNLGAIRQTNLKRLMGYSSIGHAGFLLLLLACPGDDPGRAAQSLGLYLAAYLLMNLAFFGVLVAVRAAGQGEELSSLRGLAQRSPFLASVATVALASLAGVPLTVGFLGKFLAIAAAVQAGFWWGLAAAILGGAAGFYYYLKIVLEIFAPVPAGEAGAIRLSAPLNLVLGGLTAAIILCSFGADALAPARSAPEAAAAATAAGSASVPGR